MKLILVFLVQLVALSLGALNQPYQVYSAVEEKILVDAKTSDVSVDTMETDATYHRKHYYPRYHYYYPSYPTYYKTKGYGYYPRYYNSGYRYNYNQYPQRYSNQNYNARPSYRPAAPVQQQQYYTTTTTTPAVPSYNYRPSSTTDANDPGGCC